MNELIDFTPEDADTQCKEIMLYLEQHPEGLTLFDAFLKLGCSKLSTRIGEIIRSGKMKIEKTPEIRKVGGKTKRFMRYRKAAA
jgi:hypothetical protein